MECREVCEVCLKRFEAWELVSHSVPLPGEQEGSLRRVCRMCGATIKRVNRFLDQCIRATRILHGYTTGAHTCKTLEEFILSQDHDKLHNLSNLENSNTLCIDIIPDVEFSENFLVNVYASNSKSIPNCIKNYCDGVMTSEECSKVETEYFNGLKETEKLHVENKKKKKHKKINKVTKETHTKNVKKSKIQNETLETCLDLEMIDEEIKDDFSDSSFVDYKPINKNSNGVCQDIEDDKVSNLDRNKCKDGHAKLDKEIHQDFDSMFVCRTNLSVEEQLEELTQMKTSQMYLSSPYKCTKCCIGFKFQYSLDNHMKKHSEENGNVVCVVCTQHFLTHNKLREHVRSHHSQVLQCVVCGKRLKEKKRLRDHWEAHMGIIYTCDICKRGFKNKTALIHHIPTHSAHFPCPHCSIVLRSRPTYKKHLLLHSSVRPHACQSCPRTFVTREWLELHCQRAHAPATEQYYCVECDYRFKSSREYKKHLTAKKHTDPSLLIYSCSRCPRRYATQEDLNRHTAALHDRVLSYSCSECPARFATTRGLYGHKRRVHLGYVAPKKYTCNYCNKPFRDRYYLNNHVRIHTGDVLHKCSVCLTTFTHKLALTHHMKQLHKDEMQAQ